MKKKDLRYEVATLQTELGYARRDRDEAQGRADELEQLMERAALQLHGVRREALHSKDHAKRRLERIKELVR